MWAYSMQFDVETVLRQPTACATRIILTTFLRSPTDAPLNDGGTFGGEISKRRNTLYKRLSPHVSFCYGTID
jgi:hypothetical protein